MSVRLRTQRDAELALETVLQQAPAHWYSFQPILLCAAPCEGRGGGTCVPRAQLKPAVATQQA